MRTHPKVLTVRPHQKGKIQVRSLVRSALIILAFMSSVAAQDPLKVAPESYKLEFENDWVRVVRVHYGPRARIPAHNHPRWGTAYVYLNDGPEVSFKHIGGDRGVIKRPPTKAGGFRLYKAVREVHEVENLSDTPSDFLRVEFKTKPAGESTFRGRYYREVYLTTENYQKVQFENEQIRITRIICAANQAIELASTSGQPTLLVAITSGHVSVSDQKGLATQLDIKPGETKWFGHQRPGNLKNLDANNAEFLRFDFKTKPVR